MRLQEIDILDVGNSIQMAGAVYAGKGRIYLVMFPDELGELSAGSRFESDGDTSDVVTLDMNLNEWTCFLQQTDLLETEILTRATDGKITKAIMRKSQRQISQNVSWAVFRRDKFACRYCGADDVPLTVDHLILWEEGGPSVESNLLTSCRKDNKTRGNMQYAAWLEHPYYRRVSQKLDAATRQANLDVVRTLDAIPRMKHQPTHR